MTDDTVPAATLQRLLGLSRQTLSELVALGVLRRAARGKYELEASIAAYCAHLRDAAAGRGGDEAAVARARLGSAQADLTEAKAARMRGETVELAEIEALWTRKLKAFRACLLNDAIPSRLRDLPARQSVKLGQELRAALTEFADDAA